MMKKKIAFGSIGGIFLAIAGLMLSDMIQMEMEVLILCSENEGGIRIPSNLCKYYLVNYRMNEEDIKELSEGAGLDYILYIEGRNSTNMSWQNCFLPKVWMWTVLIIIRQRPPIMRK
ncbi:MAG: hypothetical protein COB30_020085 [Ectothiorhodospiraceae bacterium]|nr:hypothetical protein [Ectothiorhodospiraceae bacterium]